MKKLMLFALVAVLMISTVSAYSWACFDEGEAMYYPSVICQNDCCRVCEHDAGYQANMNYCQSQPACACDGTVTEPPIEVLDWSIISPEEGELFSTNHFDLNLSLSENVDSMYYTIDGGSSVSIQTNQDFPMMVYSNKLSDGSHKLTVAVYYNNEYTYNYRNITIDTTAPSISGTIPVQNSLLIENNFEVAYTEKNVEEIKLFFKEENEAEYKFVILSDCESGTAKTCSAEAELSSYAQNDTIEYYFNIKDSFRDTNSSLVSVVLNETFQAACVETWGCTGWSTCASDSRQQRTCVDASTCGTEASKPVLSQGCTYTAPNTGGGSSGGGSSGGGSSGGGSSGGSSGGSVSTKPKGISLSKLWFTMEPGQYEYNVEKEGMAFMGVEFSVNGQKSNVQMILTTLEEKPESLETPGGVTYKHLEIDEGAIKETDLGDKTVIKFRVSRAWVDDEGINFESIKLLRWSNEKWNTLETELVDQDLEFYYFQAVSPGMSNFVIVGDEVVEDVVEPEETMEEESTETEDTLDSGIEEVDPDEAEAGMDAITGDVTAETNDGDVTNGPNWKLIIGTIVIIGIIAGLFFMGERLKEH
ncbi:PGF-pre-PGF domain-containing protein [archaeon]|nr:PGF-pre-PGF domain-containing protein [archaeon]